MKLIILSAGKGERLRPLTNDRPKCMVEFKDKPIIDYILDVAKELKIDNTGVICGYKADVLKNHLKDRNITFFTNENYNSTNMVSTLFCAKEFFDDDLIISYSDIIYSKEILEKLIDSTSDLSVIIDRDWQKLWELRFENPLDDAESLKLDSENNIVEIGKKTDSYDDIEGQYIGLIKISKSFVKEFIKFYENLDKDRIYDGKDFDNIYMTSFITELIRSGVKAKAVLINGSWCEIDSVSDLKAYTEADSI